MSIDGAGCRIMADCRIGCMSAVSCLSHCTVGHLRTVDWLREDCLGCIALYVADVMSQGK